MDTGDADSDDEGDGTFWDSLRFIQAVLEPCYKLMRQTDSSAPLMGKVYELMSELGGTLDDLFKEGSKWSGDPWIEHQQEISEGHTARWTYMHCDYMAAGYALDPNHLKDDVNGVNGGEVFMGLAAVIGKHYHDDDNAQAEALQQYTDFRKQRGVFALPALKAAIKTLPAYEWWDTVAGGAAELRKVAMRVLSKTPSASACERNWSAFAAVQTPKRDRLGSKVLNDLVYTRVNLRLQQKRRDPNFKDKVAEWIESTAVESDEGSDEEAVEVADEDAIEAL